MPPIRARDAAIAALFAAAAIGPAGAAPPPRPPWFSDGAADGGRGLLLAGLGDVNGDGLADFAIPAPTASGALSRSGRIDVYFGRPGGPALEPDLLVWGDRANSQFGCGVAAAGDVDGDGYDDIVVGACDRAAAHSRAGAVFLYRGSAEGLDPAPAWVFEGDARDLRLGSSLSPAGDTNGDGFADVLVGVPASNDGLQEAGRAMVFLGAPAGLGPAPAWSVSGTDPFARVGRTVAGGGDLDGDGFDDVAVGLYRRPAGQVLGRAEIYRGSATGLGTTPAWFLEDGLNRSEFGTRMRISPDADGDGLADLVVAAAGWWDEGRYLLGRVTLHPGSPDGPRPSPTWSVTGAASGEQLGAALDAGPDVNGDGLADIVVGAPSHGRGEELEGRALVFLGAPGGPAAIPAWTVEPHQKLARLGSAVALPGDVDGDGFADVLLGGPVFRGATEDTRRVVLHYGEREKANPTAVCSTMLRWECECGGTGAAEGLLDGSESHHPLSREIVFDWGLPACALDDPRAARTRAECPLFIHRASMIVSDGELDDQCLYTLEVVDTIPPLEAEPVQSIPAQESESWFGASVAIGGDVNGDGHPDLLVGAPYDSASFSYAGAAHLFFGTAEDFTSEPDWTVRGEGPNDILGWTVAPAGDVNGDGFDDVVVLGANQAAVYHGSATGLGSVPVWRRDEYLAYSSGAGAAAADLDGDGYPDLAVKSTYGPVRVFAGGPGGLAVEPTWLLNGYPDHAGWFPPFFGDAIASAGDVDGDGFEDLAIGALYHTVSIPGQGRVYVFFGSAGGPSDERSRATDGIDSEENLGWSVAAGDLNGDGFGDVCAGAPWHDVEPDGGDAGRIAAYFGGPEPTWPESDWSAYGEGPGQGFGQAMTVGDFNGDGFGDLVAAGGKAARAYLGGPSGPGGRANWEFGTYGSFPAVPVAVSAAGDLDRDGYDDLLVGAPVHANEDGSRGAVLVIRGRPNRALPVAVCPSASTWECTSLGRASGILDASASHDPAGGVLEFAWDVPSCRLEGTGAAVLADCPLGNHDVGLVVSSAGLRSRPCTTRVVVVDRLPPEGGVTLPAPGSCHGPSGVPVIVEDGFADACSPEIERTYTPAGGPAYETHGDHVVHVAAVDPSGNVASSSVTFTVDVAPPVARILAPSDGAMLPSSLPLSVVIESEDDDGAAGAIVRESIFLDACLLFDGLTYGDGDGLLADETIVLDVEALCRAASACGFDVLDHPELALDAADCGGNHGLASVGLGGGISLRPGVCGSR